MDLKEINDRKLELNLTDKMIKFAETFHINKNYAQAYYVAYGSKNNGNALQLKRKPKVQEYLELLKLEDEYKVATPKELKEFLTDMMRNEDLDSKTRLNCANSLLRMMDLQKEFINGGADEIIINTESEEDGEN